MITASALEARNRARAEAPLLLVVTRRRSAPSEQAVHVVTAAADALGLDTLSLDADDKDNIGYLDELRVHRVPELLVFSRGVVLDRGGVRDVDDCCALLAAALRRRPRAPTPGAPA